MTTYKITFGSGKDAVTMFETTNDIVKVLSELKAAGWETENITSIKKQN